MSGPVFILSDLFIKGRTLYLATRFKFYSVTGAFLSGLREAYRIFTFNDIERKVKSEVKEEPISWDKKRLSDSVPDARMPKTRRLRSRHATSYAELDVDLDFQ